MEAQAATEPNDIALPISLVQRMSAKQVEQDSQLRGLFARQSRQLQEIIRRQLELTGKHPLSKESSPSNGVMAEEDSKPAEEPKSGIISQA